MSDFDRTLYNVLIPGLSWLRIVNIMCVILILITLMMMCCRRSFLSYPIFLIGNNV